MPKVSTIHLVEETVPAHVEATGFLRSPATVRVPVETNGAPFRLYCRSSTGEPPSSATENATETAPSSAVSDVTGWAGTARGVRMRGADAAPVPAALAARTMTV